MLLTIEGPSEGEQDTCQEDGGPYRTKMLSVGQLKEYLMWGVDSHPLGQLEKTLIVSEQFICMSTITHIIVFLLRPSDQCL